MCNTNNRYIACATSSSYDKGMNTEVQHGVNTSVESLQGPRSPSLASLCLQRGIKACTPTAKQLPLFLKREHNASTPLTAYTLNTVPTGMVPKYQLCESPSLEPIPFLQIAPKIHSARNSNTTHVQLRTPQAKTSHKIPSPLLPFSHWE